MRTARGRRIIRPATALGLALTVLGGAPSVAPAAEPTPRFTTSGVAHSTATSGELEGSINPNGIVASYSYIFEYGPTTAYGKSTKPVAVPLPSPLKTIKVGQTVTGLLAGYHYRIVGTYTNAAGEAKVVHGADKSFSGGKNSKLRFLISREREERVSAVYGGRATITGVLTGLGNAGHALSVQSTPFPYTGAFTTISSTILTTRSGGFAYTVGRMTQNTEFRFATLDPRPVYSPTLTVRVTPRIKLHVRRGGGTGLYRLYGTVSPARNGSSVVIQQLLPQKPGSKRSGPRAHAVRSGILRRGKSGTSRFSVVVALSGTFRYRAYVSLPKGALDSGHSSNVLIRAPKAKAKSKRHK